MHREETLRRLLWWCLKYKEYSRQRYHMSDDCPITFCPAPAFILASKITAPLTRKEVYPDDLLDDLQVPEELLSPACHVRALSIELERAAVAIAAAEEMPAAGRARARGRGRACGRSGRGRARGHESLVPAVASGAASSSDSDSSSSSSSSDSDSSS